MPSRLPAPLLAAAICLPLAALAAPPAPRAPVTPTERLAAASGALYDDRGGARGLVPLAELSELEDEAPDLAGISRAYVRVLEDRAAHPEVRALARFQLAGLERARGNLQRAQGQLRRLGFVAGWSVIGPFDDEGKKGFDTVYPPERELAAGATYDGKAGPATWTALPPEALAKGFVHVGSAVRPEREVVAYAIATVEAPRDERVVLWFGGSGAAKVWVNGALALADPSYHVARLDQRGAEISLRKGKNRILVKLCHEGGRLGFHLRLADPRGDGRSLGAGDPFAPHAAPGPAPAPVEGAVAALEKRVRAARGARAEAVARRDLAVALALRQSADQRERRPAAEARRAAALAPGFVDAALLSARLEEEHGARRAALGVALAAAPGDPRALAALAREELDQGRPHAALALLDRAVAAAPDWAAPRVERVEALQRAGLPARAVLAAAEAVDRFPTVPGAVRAAARAARELGRSGEAVLRYRTLLALRLDDGEARGALVQLLLDRGEVDGATALLAEAIRLDPSQLAPRLRLGDVLAANGRLAAAEEAFAAAAALAPAEPDVHERRGRARLAAGKEAEALADLRRALELTPQSPGLKELVRSLEPAVERFERPYLLDAAALAAAAPAPAADDDAVVLGELQVTRVQPSGLSSSFHQRVVKIVTARGAEDFRRHPIGWTPDRQDVKVERARIVKPDGSVVEAHEESERSASEPWYRLYYDTRVRTLGFPALAPGDVLELAWRIDDTAGENLLSDYFGDLAFVDDVTRRARFEYVLLVPEERPIFSNTPEGVSHETRALPGALVEHRFSARDLAPLRPEPGMPGWSEVARFVHVSTYGDWAQVNRFYAGLIRDPLRPTEEVRATAARVAADVLARRGKARATPRDGAPVVSAAATTAPPGGWDKETRRALAEALYGFVVAQTRYVGLEFGIHGFKPYRVDQVLARRFGDCKDKAGLVHALLAAVGIESRIVLLRMRRLGRIPEAPASLAVFNHAIVYVPDLDLWLDGTAAHSGTRELPGEDRGASVLVVNPDGPPRFTTVPDAPADRNLTESRFDVVLAAEGSARLEGRSRIAGVQAPQYRRAYLAANDRRAQLELAFNRTFPGLEVQRVEISDLGQLEDDVQMSFSLAVPRYAQPDEGGLRFTPFGAGQGWAEAYGALAARRHDLVLGDPSTTRFTYRYTLPPGWELVELPDAAAGEGPHAAFDVRYRRDGAALVAEGHVTLRAARVPAAEYPAFRELLGRVDRAFARTVRIAPARAAGVSP